MKNALISKGQNTVTKIGISNLEITSNDLGNIFKSICRLLIISRETAAQKATPVHKN
jgi:hypothetical protein